MARRLAAILAADVVGYSVIMREDEAGTLAALRAHRNDLFEPETARHGGRIVKLMGDGTLVEFPSVVDAVECALSIQQALARSDGPIRLRIGINLGDVILDGDDIYGEGVNTAARLEKLAEPGGICISSVVHDSLGNRVEADFADAGFHEVKGVPQPIRVWRWPARDAPRQTESPLVLPKKPSIAVLPFENIGGDPEQECFADGLTHEIVTTLCKIERLFVVAFISTKAYKGRTVDLHQVSRDQGVRYVLSGSVRWTANRARVIAQLIDARTSQHVWGDRFDRALDDIFAVQDEITREVAVSLLVKLSDGEQARVSAASTTNFSAWELTVRAAELLNRHVREDTVRARELLEQALTHDAAYPVAWCQLGWCHWSDARHFWSDSETKSLRLAREAGERARQLDPRAAEPYALLAMTALQESRFREAASLADVAAQRAPGHSFVNAIAAMVNSYCGKPHKAVAQMTRAMRLAPLHPSWYRIVLARSQFFADNPQATIELLYGWDGYFDGTSAFPVYLIAALMETGRETEAARVAEQALLLEPRFTIAEWKAPQKCRYSADLSRLVRPLKKLGLPD